jgi:hypothetical protein
MFGTITTYEREDTVSLSRHNIKNELPLFRSSSFFITLL